MTKEYDFIIVGQGIAGTCLTVELQRLKQSVLVIDSSKLDSASNVAGGLFNPVTGRNLVLTWKASEIFPYLKTFYSELEDSLNAKFLHFLPLFRPFVNTEELNEWQGRLTQKHFQPFIEKVESTPTMQNLVINPLGGVTLKQTGFLHTKNMLSAFREKLKSEGLIRDEKFSYEELNFNSDRIVYKEHSAKQIIFADGPLGFANKLVEKIRFHALKGEVLQLDVDDETDVMLNRNAFIIPRDGRHIAGSNYDLNGNDWHATDKARSEITDKIDKFLKPEYNIIGQTAGLRPTSHDRRPVIGIHPENAMVGIFNGLGTKGVSLAPYFARQFAEHLILGKEIDREVRISRYFN